MFYLLLEKRTTAKYKRNMVLEEHHYFNYLVKVQRNIYTLSVKNYVKNFVNGSFAKTEEVERARVSAPIN